MLAQDTVKFIAVVAGIYAFFGTYGIFKEKITRRDFDGEKFQLPTSLVLAECIANIVTTVIITRISGRPLKTRTPQRFFMMLGGSYALAMVASTQALKHLSFPSQTLAKSCKAVPIMMFDFLLGRESYSLAKWAAVASIIAGVCIFSLSSSNKAGKESQYMGMVLVFVSLCCDGITGSTQTMLKNSHAPSSFEYMFHMNAYAGIYLLISLFAFGEAFTFTSLVTRHPGVLWDMAVYAVMASLGQIFIFIALTSYGPVRLALITTTRKFFTLLLSFVVYGHEVTPGVVAGATLVFAGIWLEKRSDTPKTKTSITKVE